MILGGFFLLNSNSSKSGICPLDKSNIITLGDSLANGFGVSESDSFAMQIPQMLGKNAIKQGIDGEVSTELLARIDRELQAPNIAAIIISIGGNDFLHKTDSDLVKRNITAIVKKAKAKSSCVVLLGVPDGIFGGLIGGVSSIYKDIAKSENILLESSSMPRILKQHALKVDEIHPNKDGHKIIAESITNLIKSAK